MPPKDHNMANSSMFNINMSALYNLHVFLCHIITCLFQFKDVLNKELLKILISIVDAKLLET